MGPPPVCETRIGAFRGHHGSEKPIGPSGSGMPDPYSAASLRRPVWMAMPDAASTKHSKFPLLRRTPNANPSFTFNPLEC
jgi:hypothetical protein